MTIKEAIEVYSGIKDLREARSLVLPARVAFTLTRDFRKLAAPIEDFENTRRELVIQLGQQNPSNPDEWSIKPENMDKFTQEYSSLLLSTIDDINLDKIKIEDLDGINLSIEQMDQLYPIIEENRES